ncbi:13981_t:CDS:2 [Acaulospora colombiana]|uniref:13981_t:CDS:1 n=1 Tax=Acaulospora colombiana TaxID=27376 RepID=A0ACA9MKL2_9GLOM|nr:13981_t:CDS:2 [Acaulospora colombiana]
MSVMQDRESYVPRMGRKSKRLVILQYSIIAMKSNKWQDKPKSMVQIEDSFNDDGIKNDSSPPMKGNKWQDKPKSMVQTEDSSNDNGIKDNSSLPMFMIQDRKLYMPRMGQMRKRLVILQYSVIAMKARQA